MREMAVMAVHSDAPFIVAEDKIESFKKWVDQPKGNRGYDRLMARVDAVLKRAETKRLHSGGAVANES